MDRFKSQYEFSGTSRVVLSIGQAGAANEAESDLVLSLPESLVDTPAKEAFVYKSLEVLHRTLQTPWGPG